METPILEGPGVRLEPLSLDHLPRLEAVAFEPTIWRYMLYTIRTPVDLRCWVEAALHGRDKGMMMPWVTIKKGAGDEPDMAVGATRFIDLDMNHRTVEIGNTWLGGPWRGTRVNTEAKLLQTDLRFRHPGSAPRRIQGPTRIIRNRSQRSRQSERSTKARSGATTSCRTAQQGTARGLASFAKNGPR